MQWVGQAGTLPAWGIGGWLLKKLLLSHHLQALGLSGLSGWLLCSTYTSGIQPLPQAAHPMEEREVPGTKVGP